MSLTARRALEPLGRIIDASHTLARPLCSANRLVAPFDDPVEQLWQQTACIREYQGDGHLIALASEGLSGLEASVLHGAEAGISPDLFLRSRGWTSEEWDEATAGLTDRGLLRPDGTLSQSGVSLRSHVEELTDRLASAPIETALSPADQDALVADLIPLARAVSQSGILTYPNPIGLPPV